MKRVLSVFLILLLLFPLCAAASAEPNVTPIRDAEGMFAIRSNPWGAFRLEADIDMSGVVWTTIPFKGMLDGMGHTIYNLSVTDYGSEVRTTKDSGLHARETVFGGLFSTVEDAEISDLHLVGLLVELETAKPCFAGALAGYLDHSTITRCSAEGRIRLSGDGAVLGAGGLAGYGCGSITDSSADVEIFLTEKEGGSACESYLGGLLGCGLADLDRNAIRIRGYNACRGAAVNGGIAGTYAACGMNYPADSVRSNGVDGFIAFRSGAACSAFLGEAAPSPRRYSGNRNGMEKRETRDGSAPLAPEACEEPDLLDEVTASGCTDWGYTRHTCKVCGYSWVDSYTPPAHKAEWRVSVRPTEYSAGQEQLRCTICDALLDERTLPPLVRVESCTLDRRRATLYLTETLRLNAEVLPTNATGGALTWSSSDPSVATVDESGFVRAQSRGRTFITVQTADGLGRDTCTVTVRYSLIQWLRNLFTGQP